MQEIVPHDESVRRSVCHSVFRAKVLFTNESCFTRTGSPTLTTNMWSDENPHSIDLTINDSFPSDCELGF
jgi:hypothetical protein